MRKINAYAKERRLAPARLTERSTSLRLGTQAVGEGEDLASQALEIIEVHACDDLLESPVKFGWVGVTACHTQNGNRTDQT